MRIASVVINLVREQGEDAKRIVFYVPEGGFHVEKRVGASAWVIDNDALSDTQCHDILQSVGYRATATADAIYTPAEVNA